MRRAPTLAALIAALAAAGGATTTGADSSYATRPQAGPSAIPPALRRLPPRRAVVWAVGDGADANAGGRDLAGAIVRTRPSLFLYLGDVYETGTAADFAANYDPLYGRLSRRTAPTPGNHEYANRADGYDPYWRSKLGGSLPPYYAVRIAGWTVLSLNSEDAHDPSSPQLGWLKRQLAAPGTCRIAFWHRPRFSAGPHGDQADVAPLWDALAGHAAIVLGGHDHVSQRFRPIDGLTEFVAGAGGRQRYPLRPDPRLAFGDWQAPAALRLRLRPGVATASFRRADGTVVDRSRVRCRRR